MQFDKLFKALVIGGSVLAAGCGGQATTEPAKPAPEDGADTTAETSTDTTADATNCEEVCDGIGSGAEVFCPDPNQEGNIQNCCWLMGPQQHECCPGR